MSPHSTTDPPNPPGYGILGPYTPRWVQEVAIQAAASVALTPHPPPRTPERLAGQEAHIRAALAAGETPRNLARQCGVSKSVMHYFIKRHHLRDA
jgi:hypothetical protein